VFHIPVYSEDNIRADEHSDIPNATISENNIAPVEQRIPEKESVFQEKSAIERINEAEKTSIAQEGVVNQENETFGQNNDMETETVVDVDRITGKTSLSKDSKIVQNENKNEISNNLISSVSLSGGITNSHLKSSEYQEYFFSPTSKVQHINSPTVLLEYEISYKNIFGFCTGLHFEKVGQYTKKTTVEIQNDPFLHDFESKAEIFYV
jgi:hypothetical protein